MYQETSRLAYESIKDNLGPRQRQIYDLIELNAAGMTNHEISQYSGLPINCVTPRVLELRQLDLVGSLGIKKDISGRPAVIWGII
jgi:hypothetical protein